MYLFMLIEMVTSREPLVAEIANKFLITCVRPHVTLEFIRSSKGLTTCLKAALEGSLIVMPAEVSGEMTSLTVRLSTNEADVNLPLCTIALEENLAQTTCAIRTGA